jgi:hypothetical protein
MIFLAAFYITFTFGNEPYESGRNTVAEAS